MWVSSRRWNGLCGCGPCSGVAAEIPCICLRLFSTGVNCSFATKSCGYASFLMVLWGVLLCAWCLRVIVRLYMAGAIVRTGVGHCLLTPCAYVGASVLYFIHGFFVVMLSRCSFISFPRIHHLLRRESDVGWACILWAVSGRHLHFSIVTGDICLLCHCYVKHMISCLL